MSLDTHFRLCPESPSYIAWARDSYGKSRRFKEGDFAGIVGQGYYLLSIPGDRKLLAHRVVYELVHGHCPEFVDHADRDGFNNNPANLRAASHSENSYNKPANSNNAVGVKGLFYSNSTGRWHGQVKAEGRLYRKSSAHRPTVEAWLIATRIEQHGEFSCH